jgi:hypothetical protein
LPGEGENGFQIDFFLMIKQQKNITKILMKIIMIMTVMKEMLVIMKVDDADVGEI